MSHSEAIRHRFLMLRTQGLSFDKIAQKLQVSKHTLLNWSKELAPEFQVLQALHTETLQEELLAAHEQRMQLIHTQLETIQKELATRDLKAVSTATLFRLVLVHVQALKREVIDPFAALKDVDLSKVNPVLLLTPEDAQACLPARTKTAPESASETNLPRPPAASSPPIQNPKSKIQNDTVPDAVDSLITDLLRTTPADRARAQALLDRCPAAENHRK